MLNFKNIAPFRSCISEINNTFVDNAENFDIIQPIHNLLNYSSNYSMASGNMWNYYKDKVEQLNN